MTVPRIYVDFQNADRQGRVRLTCNGTVRDLADQGVQLQEGQVLALYDDCDADDDGTPVEMRTNGTASYSPQEQCWVAIIDWHAIDRIRLEPPSLANGIVHSSTSNRKPESQRI
jgi:hypothetical protein